MKNGFKISLVIFISFLFTTVALAAVPVMPVSELREGMKGIGKTVIRGTEIEEFSVEILGVLKNQGPVKNLILVRVSGPVIDKTGGIAQGMSGSPVIIDGKLVGAVAYGWGFADGRLGLLTPAEDMVKLWNLPHDPLPRREVIDISDWQDIITPQDAERDRWNEIKKVKVKKEEPAGSESKGTSSDGDGGQKSAPLQLPEVQLPEGGIRPLATPLLVSGLTPKAMELLKTRLAPFNLIPYATGSDSSNIGGTIEPGSAIGAQFVRGDISMGALGTTTWVDDGNVIAFGHPFLHDGQSSYFMTTANVIGVIPSMESAFKLGTIGDLVGMIDQDRRAGISGKVNYFPRTTMVKLMVNDGTEKRSEVLNFEVIQDEKISPVLIPVSVYSGIGQVLDRNSGGTTFVQMRVRSKQLPKGEVVRSELFYGSKDAADIAISELDFVMQMLAQNPFEKVQIDEIEIEVNMIADRKVAQIIRAGTAQKSVYPGEFVEVEVEIQPYREPRRVEKIRYQVPSYAPSGDWVLLVRGGASQWIPEDLPNEAVYQIWHLQKEKWLAPKDLKDLVNTYLDIDHNQDLIVEGYFIPTKKDIEKAKEAKKSIKTSQSGEGKLSPLEENSLGSTDEIHFYERSFKARRTEPWIIVGNSQILLHVKKEKDSENGRGKGE